MGNNREIIVTAKTNRFSETPSKPAEKALKVRLGLDAEVRLELRSNLGGQKAHRVL